MNIYGRAIAAIAADALNAAGDLVEIAGNTTLLLIETAVDLLNGTPR